MRSAYFLTLAVSIFALQAAQAAAAEGYYFRNVPGKGLAGDSAQPLAMSANAFPSSPSAGDSAAGTFKATGGTPPYSYAKSGSYPTGVDLGSDGALVGSFPQPGTYTLGATVTDARNQSAALSMTVQVRPAPPSVALSAPATAIAGLGFAASAVSGNPDSPLTWSLTGTTPAWLSIDSQSGYIFGSTPTTGTEFSLTATGADAYGRAATSTAAVSIVQPYLSSNLALPIYPGDRVAFALQTNLSSPEFGATGLPAWLTRQGASFTGTAPATTGSYGFQATAKQGGVNTGVTVPVAISSVDVAVSGLPATVNAQAQFTGKIAATAGTGWSYSLAGKPAEMAVDPTTGALTGTVADRAETLTVTPTATRNGVTVTGAARSLAIIQPAKITMAAKYGYRTNAASSAIAPSFTGSTGSRTWSLSANKPAGMSIDASTGVISVVPGSSPVAPIAITVSFVDSQGKNASANFVYEVTSALSVYYASFYGNTGYPISAKPTIANALGPLKFTKRNESARWPFGVNLDQATGDISGSSNLASWDYTLDVNVLDTGDASGATTSTSVGYVNEPLIVAVTGGGRYGGSSLNDVQTYDSSGFTISAGQTVTIDYGSPVKYVNQFNVNLKSSSVQFSVQYKSSPSENWQVYDSANLSAQNFTNYGFQSASNVKPTVSSIRIVCTSGSMQVDAIRPYSFITNNP